MAIVGLALIGWTIRANNGFEARVSADQLSMNTANLENRDCLFMSPLRAKSRQFCKLGSANLSEPSFFVWGDSHATAFDAVLDAIAKKQGAAGLLAATGGCPPLLDIVRKDPEAQDCAGINQNIFEFIVAEKSIKNVILIGRWAIYSEGTSYKDQPTNRFNPAQYVLENRSIPESKSMPEMIAVALDQTVSVLLAAKKHIWIVGPVPEVEVNIPKALYLKSLGIGRGYEIEPTREDFDRRQAHVIPILEAVAQKYPVTLFGPTWHYATKKPVGLRCLESLST